MFLNTVGSPALWAGFLVLIGLLLALDLGLSGKRHQEMSRKTALLYSLFWIGVALLFNLFVYLYFGEKAGTEFLTGYLIEKALSVDNIFVFLILFRYFAVPGNQQHRVLFYGILGALIMRGAFIIAGTVLIEKFFWLTYLLGALLVYTAFKLVTEQSEDVNPEHNKALQMARKFLPATENYEGKNFFVKRNGKRLVTPLFFVLIAVETTDLVFAIDSIPAIFAITTDPFIVFTSNIFAILGLRALYFLLASMLAGLRFLRFGLSAVLLFIGLKMLGHSFLHIPTELSLIVIASILSVSVIASLIFPAPKEAI